MCAHALATDDVGLIPGQVIPVPNPDIPIADLRRAVAFSYHMRDSMRPVHVTFLQDSKVEFYYSVATRGQAVMQNFTKFNTTTTTK